MAKATTSIRQSLHYPPQRARYFAENAALFNRVGAFYFSCIQAHEDILALTNKEALTALEKLTHATAKNPHPIMPLVDLAPDIPAMFRRAAINAALGSARSYFSSLNKWRVRKAKHEANIGNGTAIAGCRKKLLGRIARNRSQTGIIAENEQDNADFWRKIRHVDERIAHLMSARIVQFAQEQQASILLDEGAHLQVQCAASAHAG